MNQEWVVSIAVPRPFDQTFDYLVPSELLESVKPGAWVTVPFGRSKTHAYVVSSPRPRATQSAETFQLKSLFSAGPEVMIPSDVLALCQWASDYYGAPLGELLQAAMPASALGLRNKKAARPLKNLVGASTENSNEIAVANSEGLLLSPNRNLLSLTSDQQRAVEELWLLGGSKPGVLKGVTGSGKTEVYLELARRTLAKNRSVIVMVPEIALTSQLHQRIQEGLGETVVLWHSAVANGVRRDVAEAIRQGKVRAVIGARSAVFAPVADLGLLVVDEEHDSTYKQEDRVRYNARDLAIVRAKHTGAQVVLGSATLSLETQERVREERYWQSCLPNRIGAGGAPEVEIVDLSQEERVEGLQAPFAKRSLEAIRTELVAGNQVIVFLNRRGFSSSLVCEDCGDVSNCQHCSVALTLHKNKRILRCHTCGHEEPIADICQKCQGMNLKPLGAGTESLEEQLPGLLPEARLVRLDRDVITSVTRLEKILGQFRRGEANLLLGTQMLAKGHDFPNVTLVVVVLADGLFRFPDFRSAERGYQLLKQVIGRAGRADRKGRALIQTFAEDHPVLQAIQGRISEDEFYEAERDLRKVLLYPPIGRLLRVRVSHEEAAQAKRQATQLAQSISDLFRQNNVENSEVLGPSEAFIERVQGLYRFDLLVKSQKIEPILRASKLAKSIAQMNRWEVIADVDPISVG